MSGGDRPDRSSCGRTCAPGARSRRGTGGRGDRGGRSAGLATGRTGHREDPAVGHGVARRRWRGSVTARVGVGVQRVLAQGPRPGEEPPESSPVAGPRSGAVGSTGIQNSARFPSGSGPSVIRRAAGPTSDRPRRRVKRERAAGSTYRRPAPSANRTDLRTGGCITVQPVLGPDLFEDRRDHGGCARRTWWRSPLEWPDRHGQRRVRPRWCRAAGPPRDGTVPRTGGG